MAAAYAVVARRRPSSLLRFLVAPLVWIAVAAVGLGFATTIPSGDQVSHPFPAQWALVTVAVAATLALVRRRPDLPLARPTELAAIPGLALAEVITVLSAATSGWPAVPLVVAGLATLVGLELLAPRLAPRALVALQALTIVVTTAALQPTVGLGWSAVTAAAALLALTEWRDRQQPDVVATGALLGGVAVALALTLSDPWPTVAAFGGAWAWSVARRAWPLRVALPDPVLAVAIAVLPFGVAAGLGQVLPLDTTLVVLAAAVVAVAARGSGEPGPDRRPVGELDPGRHRPPADHHRGRRRPAARAPGRGGRGARPSPSSWRHAGRRFGSGPRRRRSRVAVAYGRTAIDLGPAGAGDRPGRRRLRADRHRGMGEATAVRARRRHRPPHHVRGRLGACRRPGSPA